MKIKISFVLVLFGIVAGTVNAKGKYDDDSYRYEKFSSKHLATSAIPCTPEVGLRFSCSNKSSSETLKVLGAKCIIGAGENPEVQTFAVFDDGVAPETTEVASVSCPDVAVPAFCKAKVSSPRNARCVVTSPGGSLNSELR